MSIQVFTVGVTINGILMSDYDIRIAFFQDDAPKKAQFVRAVEGCKYPDPYDASRIIGYKLVSSKKHTSLDNLNAYLIDTRVKTIEHVVGTKNTSYFWRVKLSYNAQLMDLPFLEEFLQ
jgi:hypothetical protein